MAISDTLSWSNHLYGDANNCGLLRTLSKRVGLLAQLRKYVKPDKFLSILNGLFMSKLTYGITAWGHITGIPGQMSEFRAGITKRDILRLQSIQNKAVRLNYYRDRSFPTKQLLKESHQLSINQLIAYHISVQTFKIRLSKKPEYHYHRLFKEDTNTRTRSDNIRRVEFRLNLGRSSFFYQANRLWTALPNNIKNCPSLNIFKKRTKEWIWENIPTKP